MSDSEMVPVRRCPECAEEFQPHVVSCSDCGAPLEDAVEGQPIERRDAAPAAADGPFVPLTGIVEMQDALDAGQALAATSVRFRLLPVPRRAGLKLEVHEQDAAAATALLVQAGLLPPLDDSPAVGEDGGPCPACGTHVAAGSIECAECGLVLGGDLPES
jgi:hypothetical protein